MVVKTKKMLVASVGLALALNVSSCKKDKETDRLVGEWNVEKFDNQVLGSDYGITFEFQEDRDFRFEYQYDGYTYGYSGTWEWRNDDRTDIDIDINAGGATLRAEIEIDVLTNDVLEGDFISDGDVFPFEAVKVE